MDIRKVLELLPHRYPFLLVDRVEECVPGERLLGYKNVTFNEPFFTGHFPVKPVMPGVLIVEALAQATGLLAMETEPDEARNKLYYFVGIDKARFKKPVEPGDRLDLEVHLKGTKRGIWMFTGEARVDGAVVATAEIMCTSRDY
ncbi:MAG: 3-hydroxyacyl-[acyl-carrier-protein] dehydratase FabZ [Gammaproteobacteria bacterium RIFOXYA12_FULL_61_12]|nr:MAG: 3-hydroxyacyl-[acyl-carrier-protein] dehydratase FabZ [Gammaproteobacteria bacterium RIFOXYD12_FULL_61_37]OGT94196.1 MAG: 3-hydroxyacyl-[acyl-carrier-protein] dehydratase FabZ [Gammaproteobacteria bacterium RIFOXYA12_FULL_61_12]